jgi:lyso-ornithine lipid O-acyltransferase
MIALSLPKADPIGPLRFAHRAFWIGGILIPTLVLHLLWQLLGLSSPWPRLFLKMTARALGVRVHIIGKPRRKNVFFVANHVSWIDIPILGGITGTAFVAQDGVAKWPVIGWLAKLNRTIFISRTEKQNVGQQIADLRAAITENWTVTLFPEGTTSDGHGFLPFKPSLFATLVPPPAGMLVQPVLLDFGDVGPEVAWLGEETGWESAWRAFTRKGSYGVRVHFLEPFDPRAFPCRKELAVQVRSRLAKALAR